MNRRSFLQATATASGGFLLSFYADDLTAVGAEFRPNGYVRIDANGTITLWAKNPDMKDGSRRRNRTAIRRIDTSLESIRGVPGSEGQPSQKSTNTPTVGMIGTIDSYRPVVSNVRRFTDGCW